ncbi:hypothetical protein R3I93_004662 [Phoxinus phoxinus]|uniref:Uncharacterized protein n=1 Tax=Phoxinus phoxinus TaxID=58324 RepID=A0AAN9HGR7_9TELE
MDSDVTSSSTSPEDAVPEPVVSTPGSNKDESSQQQGSGEMAAVELKKLRVVLTPMGLKARLRPRRISPLQIKKIVSLSKTKEAAKKGQEIS